MRALRFEAARIPVHLVAVSFAAEDGLCDPLPAINCERCLSSEPSQKRDNYAKGGTRKLGWLLESDLE